MVAIFEEMLRRQPELGTGIRRTWSAGSGPGGRSMASRQRVRPLQMPRFVDLVTFVSCGFDPCADPERRARRMSRVLEQAAKIFNADRKLVYANRYTRSRISAINAMA